MSEMRCDLAQDIHDTLKTKENTMLQLMGNGTVLGGWRRQVVDTLASIRQKYQLNATAQHLAVCLFDRFVDQHRGRHVDHRLLAICCLLVASKFEEREEKIPKFKTLVESMEWRFSAAEYLEMEIRLLSEFHWDIGFPTAAHFKDYYMMEAFSARDTVDGRIYTDQDHRNYWFILLDKYVDYFLETSLQQESCLVFKPSLITAACIAASRFCLKIRPTWTIELQMRTCFSWGYVAPCVDFLLQCFGQDAKFVTQDGFHVPHVRRKVMRRNDPGSRHYYAACAMQNPFPESRNDPGSAGQSPVSVVYDEHQEVYNVATQQFQTWL